MHFALIILVYVGSVVAEVDHRIDLRLCLLKRGTFNQDATPCKCSPGEETLVDLGRGHFPRYLASFQCDGVSCLNHPYYCTGVSHKVQVLKRREFGENVDPHVPETLNAAWKMVHVPVNIACVCNAIYGSRENDLRPIS